MAEAAGRDGIKSRRLCRAGAGDITGGTNRDADSMQWKMTW